MEGNQVTGASTSERINTGLMEEASPPESRILYSKAILCIAAFLHAAISFSNSLPCHDTAREALTRENRWGLLILDF